MSGLLQIKFCSNAAIGEAGHAFRLIAGQHAPQGLHLLAYGGRDLCHNYRSILNAAHRSIPSMRLKPLRSLAGLEIPNREKGASR
ncbi:hypothetical protein J2Z31_005532 [Sinorhizobium kostiense]|uniref:Transposase n=1 Tax=Sinorhizobium kostiense TaxID=76747 RepID=A0ABS4R9D0_9HYPH|nr:hypothetical protein [Sinorhizobium kostiense]